MTNYVVIDCYSGHIWGVAGADDVIEAVKKIDDSANTPKKSYSFNPIIPDNHERCYEVYELPENVDPEEIYDGQDEESINLILSFPFIGYVDYEEEWD